MGGLRFSISMFFTQYFYKRTVASLCNASNRLVKQTSIHFASTAYSSHIWFTHRPQLSFQFSMIWIRLSLDWHHVFWFTIHWNILLFVYYGQDTWASTSVLPCRLQSACESWSDWRIDRRPDAARRCGEDRSPPSPATSCGWTGSLAGCPPPPLHFTHRITPRPHHSTSSTSRLEQMWEPRRPTVVMSLGALHGTRPTRRSPPARASRLPTLRSA